MKPILAVVAILTVLAPQAYADVTDPVTNEAPRCQVVGLGLECADDEATASCEAATANLYTCRLRIGSEHATLDGVDPDDLDLDGFATRAQAQAGRTAANAGNATVDTVTWVQTETGAYVAFLTSSVDGFCDALVENWTRCVDAQTTVDRWSAFLVGTPNRLLVRADRIVTAFEEYMVTLDDDVLLKLDLSTYGLPGHMDVDDGDTCGDAQVEALNTLERAADCNTRVEAGVRADVHCNTANEVTNGRPHCPGEWSSDWREHYTAAGVTASTPDGRHLSDDTLTGPQEDAWIGDGTAVGSVDDFRAHMMRSGDAWIIDSPTGVFACRGLEGRFYARPVVLETDHGFRALLSWIHEDLGGDQFDGPLRAIEGAADAVGQCRVTGQQGSYRVDLSDMRSRVQGVGVPTIVAASGEFPCHIDEEPTGLAAHAGWRQGQPNPASDTSAVSSDHVHYSLIAPFARQECAGH